MAETATLLERVQGAQSVEAFFAVPWGADILAGATADVLSTSLALSAKNRGISLNEVMIELVAGVEAGMDAYIGVEVVVSGESGSDNFTTQTYETLNFKFDGSATTRSAAIPLNLSAAREVKISKITNNDTGNKIVTDTLNINMWRIV